MRKLNFHTHQKAKLSLEEFLAPIVRLDPYCDEFKIELSTIEKHLTGSSEEVYRQVIKVLDHVDNSYLYD